MHFKQDPGEAYAIGAAVRTPLQGEGTQVLLLLWNQQGERSHREVEAEINISINCHTIHDLMPMMKSYWPTHGSDADFPKSCAWGGSPQEHLVSFLPGDTGLCFQRLLLSLELRNPAWGSWPLLLVR